jgi:hypothetical protein
MDKLKSRKFIAFVIWLILTVFVLMFQLED